jgi:hypothetical protein
LAELLSLCKDFIPTYLHDQTTPQIKKWNEKSKTLWVGG